MVVLMEETLALSYFTILQGVEAIFQVLATDMGHEDGETEKGWAGSKCLLKNDLDEYIRVRR
jgi:hypothetical protein